MADLGLMGGLAAGLQAGLSSYQQAKKYNDEEQHKKADEVMKAKLYKIQMAQAGYQENPDDPNGGLMVTPQHQQELDLSKAKTTSALSGLQPNSPYAETIRGAAVRQAKLTNPNLTDDQLEQQIPHGLMADQYEKLAGIMKPEIAGYYGMQGKQAFANAYKDVGTQRNQIASGNLDLRKSNQAMQFGKGVNNDKIVLASDQQNNAIQKGVNALNSGTVTPQLWHEIQIDLANAISGGRTAAQGTIHNVTADTMATKAAQMEQYVTSHPEDIGSPQMKQYVKDRLMELQKLNQKIKQDRVKELGQTAGQAAPNNQYVSSVIGGLNSSAAPQMAPEDKQAIEWAQGNPKDPRAQKILKAHGM